MQQLERLARRQAGVFTRGQALRLGITPGQIEQRLVSDDWVIVVGQVMRAATTPVTPQLQAWAGVLAIGQPVALAGRFGAAAVGLERAPGWYEPEFVIPGNRRRRELPGVEVRRMRPSRFEVVWRHGLPILPTPVLIRGIAAGTPLGVVRDVAQHALRRRTVSEQQLIAQLGRGWPGAARLRQALEELAPGYQSMWERRVHRALRRAGVVLTPQVEVTATDGRTAFIDLGDDVIRFGVEIDGFLNHMARFAADRRRARMLALEVDWTIAPYAVEELIKNFDAVIAEIVREVRLRYAGRAA